MSSQAVSACTGIEAANPASDSGAAAVRHADTIVSPSRVAKHMSPPHRSSSIESHATSSLQYTESASMVRAIDFYVVSCD